MSRKEPICPHRARAALSGLLIAAALGATDARGLVSQRDPGETDAVRAAGDGVRLRLVVVRASGKPRAEGPSVASELEDIPAPWTHLGFGRYDSDQSIERDAPWNERIAVAYDDGGSYVVTPTRPPGGGRGSMKIEQRLPGEDEPCLVHHVRPLDGRWSVPYCRVEIDGTTWIFVVQAAKRGP